jgi:hypothetical protein
LETEELRKAKEAAEAESRWRMRMRSRDVHARINSLVSLRQNKTQSGSGEEFYKAQISHNQPWLVEHKLILRCSFNPRPGMWEKIPQDVHGSLQFVNKTTEESGSSAEANRPQSRLG